MCKKKESYIGKTVDDIFVEFKYRMNQHISERKQNESLKM